MRAPWKLCQDWKRAHQGYTLLESVDAGIEGGSRKLTSDEDGDVKGDRILHDPQRHVDYVESVSDEGEDRCEDGPDLLDDM